MQTVDELYTTGVASLPQTVLSNDIRRYSFLGMEGVLYHCSSSGVIVQPKCYALYINSTQYLAEGGAGYAQYDMLRFNIYMTEGTYDLQAFVMRYLDRGRSSLYIDGVYKGYLENFLAGGGFDFVYIYLTNFTVTGSKIHTVDLRMDTKDPSSIAYDTLNSCYTFYPHV